MDIDAVRSYCLSRPHATEDMPFGSEYVVFRIGGKIFCCLALVIDRYSYVRQAWHWHKRHMIQFDLDETTVPDAVARELIDRAYAYVRRRLPKKIQSQLASGAD